MQNLVSILTYNSINKKRKFISIKFKNFYKKKNIALKYVAAYIHIENSMAKKNWQTIIKKKNLLLLDNRFLLNFWSEIMDTINYS